MGTAEPEAQGASKYQSCCLQISEGESRLKQQQNLYETVRADRNVYSKNLVQAQDEIQELKRKFKIMVRVSSADVFPHHAMTSLAKLSRIHNADGLRLSLT